MIGFALDQNGDVVIQNNKIVMVSDNELTRQTMRTVVGTNNGEWFLNTDEGINFKNILVKNPDYDVIKGEVTDGIKQVDKDFVLNSFDYSLDKNRNLKIDFEATNGNNTINTQDCNKEYKTDKYYEVEKVSNESNYNLQRASNYPIIGLNLYGKSVQDGTPTPKNPVDIVSVGCYYGLDIITKNDNHFNLLTVSDNGGNGIITKQPVSVVEKVGERAIFTVDTNVTDNTYQWQLSKDNGLTWINININATKPIIIYAVGGNDTIDVEWTAVEGASKYRVFTKLPGKTLVTRGDTTNTTFTITGLESNTTYMVLVRANVNGVWTTYVADDYVKVTTIKDFVYENTIPETFTSLTGNKIILQKAQTTFNYYQYRCVVTAKIEDYYINYISNAATLYVVNDDCEISTSRIATNAMPLCGIPVPDGGNYTDKNGQQWICDEFIYNYNGVGKVIKHTAQINSYNGETILGSYISTTGSLTNGAKIIYQLKYPQEIPFLDTEINTLKQLRAYEKETNVFNNAKAEMTVEYQTVKYNKEV